MIFMTRVRSWASMRTGISRLTRGRPLIDQGGVLASGANVFRFVNETDSGARALAFLMCARVLQGTRLAVSVMRPQHRIEGR
jgi:hypothetical protein